MAGRRGDAPVEHDRELDEDELLPEDVDMLIVSRTADDEIAVETPMRDLSDDTRIALLWRALLLESGDTIVALLAAMKDEDDGDDDAL